MNKDDNDEFSAHDEEARKDKKEIDDNVDTKNDKIESLLGEFTEQRVALLEMIKDLDKIKQKVDILFPDKIIDVRYVRLFEEKIKAATELFKVIIDIRKEVSRSIKEEIDMRKKFKTGALDADDIFESMLDIRELARKVEKYREPIVTKRKGEIE